MKFSYMFTGGVSEVSIAGAINFVFEKYYDDPNAEFTFYISSVGGDIESAIRFYDFIKAAGVKFNTVGFSQVHSSAIILFLTGKKRTLIEDCKVRLHLPTYSGSQTPQVISVHSEQVELLRQLDNRYFEILRTELPLIKDLRKVFSDGKMLDTKEALSLGLATDVQSALPIDK